ncbi:hypothetical protein CK203_002332 [Vitis vinifera]|uniref:Endonuclease/exonuclease/phosphatase domain-containing protein n=1 Tax=Vitis vinifera TaxID=29760 RepID=A0A438KK45_VITVI|nr:hypothetical protein CK203_002332 [Vitis vinifera]
MREKIHSKGLLEKSRFERELKRLECSVNYEGEGRRKCPLQGRGGSVSGCPMNLKLLSWNVRRANESMERKAIKSIIKKQKVDLFYIQETKIQVMFDRAWECLWEEIGAIRGIWEGPWCLRGDFNIILSQSERSRQGRITSAMRRFAQVVDELGFMDLQLQGELSRGSGGLNNQSRARLDRFLVTPYWLDQFSRVIQRRLPRPTSAHFPVLLEGGSLRRGEAYPFQIRKYVVQSREELKQKLKVRNREVFGNLKCNKDAALQQVEYWDRVEGERSLTVEELACKKQANEGYAKWVDLEETIGDRLQGTAFRKLGSGGWTLEAFNLTKSVFKKRGCWSFLSLEAEVQAALMDMNGDKAPGPDGFTLSFWQVARIFWLLLKLEGVAPRGPPFPLSLCHGDGSVSVLIRRAVEEGFISGSVSGLRINLAKNEIIPIGEVEEVEEMAVELGCRVGQLLAVYLGLPLGAPNKAISRWDGVEEKVRRRLALRKDNIFQRAGESLL